MNTSRFSPELLHRRFCCRTIHDNFHVRGNKEEGSIIPRICLQQQLKDKLIEHKQYIDKHGEDMPEIRNWKWKG